MFYRQSRDLENTRVEQTCERINYLLFVRILKAPICYSHGNLVKTFIKLGESTPLGKHLGCGHTMCDVPSPWVDSEPTQSLLRGASDDLEAVVEKRS